MDTATNPVLTSFAYRQGIEAGCSVSELHWLAGTGFRASVIYADPPWKFKARSIKGMGRSAERHYNTMPFAEIAGMRPAIDAVAAKDTVLCLWATMPHLANAMSLIEDWGFTFKTAAFVWVKISKEGKPIQGQGFWTRANAEICLLATRGKPKRQAVATDVAQIITARRRGHSVKPAAIRGRIERLLPGPYLELFARQQTPGWMAWGNEIPRDQFRAAAYAAGYFEAANP